MARQIILPTSAKFGGIPLSELAKQEKAQQQKPPVFRGQNPLPSGIFVMQKLDGKPANYDNNQGLAAWDAVNQANQQGLTIIANLQADERLNGAGKLWEQEKPVYPLWTDFFAYNKPDAKLDSTLEFTFSDSGKNYRVVVDVPDNYRKEKNSALWTPHGFNPDGSPFYKFTLEGTVGNLTTYKIEFPNQSVIQLVENIPKEDGWALTDAKSGVPVGKILEDGSDTAARYLWRIENFVGLLRRGCGIGEARVGRLLSHCGVGVERVLA